MNGKEKASRQNPSPIPRVFASLTLPLSPSLEFRFHFFEEPEKLASDHDLHSHPCEVSKKSVPGENIEVLKNRKVKELKEYGYHACLSNLLLF
ncbi:hypothetical protein L6164_018278 [Bauhinia variegata]|uniref:Uncharacterized protein n=1 Tax=Bauhinia variegata TaxID=167791 RepID=A0ACB9NCP9_BAUVA|nr:hypothetical protein L6164_018278 [Bauhinia variegata]